MFFDWAKWQVLASGSIIWSKKIDFLEWTCGGFGDGEMSWKKFFCINLSGRVLFLNLRKLIITEIVLYIMKNIFYVILNDIFVFKIFRILTWLSGYVNKQLHKKLQVNFKISDVTGWTKNNYDTQILSRISKTKGNQEM